MEEYYLTNCTAKLLDVHSSSRFVTMKATYKTP